MNDKCIKDALPDHEHPRDRLQVFDEHGYTWVICLDCGAQWCVHQSDLTFEKVTQGDSYCLDNFHEQERHR